MVALRTSWALASLLLASCLPLGHAKELFKRPETRDTSRQGRFLSAHLDLLSAASSLFPSLRSTFESSRRVDTDYDEEELVDTAAEPLTFASKADKLVASETDLSESDTIRDMSDNLSDVESFGAKLGAETAHLEEEIAEQIAAMDASGGEPPEKLEEVFSAAKQEEGEGEEGAAKTRIKSSYRRPSYEPEQPYPRPEGTPQPLIIICEDPAYCPPPAPAYPRYPPPQRRPSYGGPGLTICRDPANCRPHRHRPYRIKSKRPVGPPAEPAPTYEPVEATKPTFKKYGYNPNKPTNPTIWRQQVMKVRKPAPKESEENLQAGPPAEHEADIDNIRTIQKEYLDKHKPVKESDSVEVKSVNEMSMKELKSVIKEAVIEEVELDKSEKLITPPTQTTTVAPVIEDAINKMTMTELKEFIMENVVENEEEIHVPEVEEEDLQFMSRNQMKEVIKETVMMNDGDNEVVAPIIEETVNRLTNTELKEVIMEAVENEKPEEIVAPLVQDAINHMSMPELKEFIADTVLAENDQTEEIIAPLVENALKKMSRKELKNIVMETVVSDDEEKEQDAFKELPKIKEDVKKITEPKNVDDINKMTMQELKDFIEKNTAPVTTKRPPVKDQLAIKEGMLFKNGMTMKEIKAEEKGMSVAELIGKEEGVRMRDVHRIKDGVTVEEMIAMKNDVSVPEMVAMKNDLTVEQVMKIKEVLPVQAIVQTRPEIPLEEAMALKANMTIEELVAMKNEIPVEEVLELKEELEMESIMKLQDGITKEEAVAIIEDKASVEEIVKIKEEINEISKLEGITIESERFPNFAKEGQKEMTLIDIDANNEDDIVRFVEVSEQPEDVEQFQIIESVRNTKPFQPERKEEKKEKRKKLQMKMRPLRVKVRKPPVSEEEDEEPVPDPMDDTFGLKNVMTKDDLVLEPTPAVPDKPVISFDDFLPSTSPPTLIPVDNIKTVDFQNQDVTESEFPIYDIEDEGDYQNYDYDTKEEAPAPAPPVTQSSFMSGDFSGMKMSDFPDMPIFSNFPMMQPHEFINLIASEDPDSLGENQESQDENGFLQLGTPAMPEKDNFVQFNNPDRPESIPPYVPPVSDIEEDDEDDFNTFVDVFKEEQPLFVEDRPVRRPQRPNPNHRYPVQPLSQQGTPFTVKPKSQIVDHSYMKNSYKHQSGGSGYDSESSYNRGSYDSSDTALFREIADDDQEIRLRRKPYQERNPHLKSKKQSSKTEVKSFTHFGSINDKDKEKTYEKKIPDTGATDYNDQSLVGVDFHNQYGQHDDRPLRLPTPTTKKTQVKEEDKRRPGEIRFGGMSFALPPPGTFPDIPLDEEEPEFEYYSDYEYKTVSDVYPNHPASEIFPNRPVSEIFRDLPEKMSDTLFPPSSGIRIEETIPSHKEIPSFSNFFDSEKYIDNPFGKDFIKLEIDVDRFSTNKTKPGVHHIPLDIHGFPDIPNYNMDEDLKVFEEKSERRKVKKSTKRKPLYKPPPVLTEYSPPKSSSRLSPEYRHQYPDTSSSIEIDQKETLDLDNTPLKGLTSLPLLMERLMGEHSAWIKRAWQGRDEAAAAAA